MGYPTRQHDPHKVKKADGWLQRSARLTLEEEEEGGEGGEEKGWQMKGIKDPNSVAEASGRLICKMRGQLND